MNKKTKTLVTAMAMAFSSSVFADVSNKPNDTWYQIKASSKDDNAVSVVIYDDIGAWGVTAQQFANELSAKAQGKKTINCHIHSLGGDVFEGLAIYSMIKNHPAYVNMYIGGIAASMGSVIAMAGDKIYIPENSWIMVHKPWGIQGGNADDMRKYADLLDQFEDSLLGAYRAKTNLSDDELKALLETETWLMGQAAIDKGFADELTESVDISASLPSKRFEDYHNMPNQAKALLKPQGNGSSTPNSNTPNNPTVETPEGDNQTQAQFQEQEQNRRTAVENVFKPFAATHADLMNDCLLDMNVTASDAQAKLLGVLGQSSGPAGGSPSAIIHAGNGNIVEQGLINALAARSGLEKLEDPKNHFKGMALIEMARASLSEKGISTYGMDRMEMIGLAFTHTSSDFGNVLEGVAKKAMLKGAEEAEETFQLWTSKGELGDFKVTKRVGLDSFPTLDKVEDGAEYKHATLKDKGETIQLATYGKLFSITRQTIINDDLGVFTRIPRHMGRAALRTIGNLVYAVLTSNPKMSDGKALFHADHKNLHTGAVMSIESISEMDSKMGLHEDSTGSVLNISPEYLICSRQDKALANTLMTSMYDPNGKHAHVPNPVNGLAQVIADARIDKAAGTNARPWFMSAGQSHDTIEVSYLDGNENPHLEQQTGWSIDGTQYKVRMDAGVSPMSSRTIHKNPGSN